LEAGNQTPWTRIYSTEGEQRAIAIYYVLYRDTLNNAKRRLNRGNLTSFVRRWSDWKTALHSPSSLILCLGELKSSTMMSIVALNMFGQSESLLQAEQLTYVARQLLLGNYEDALGHSRQKKCHHNG